MAICQVKILENFKIKCKNTEFIRNTWKAQTAQNYLLHFDKNTIAAYSQLFKIPLVHCFANNFIYSKINCYLKNGEYWNNIYRCWVLQMLLWGVRLNSEAIVPNKSIIVRYFLDNSKIRNSVAIWRYYGITKLNMIHMYMYSNSV